MSQLTTHVLDTSQGKPAYGLHIILCQHHRNKWTEIAKGITDEEGRLTNLLKKNAVMELGTYKLRFETQAYFSRQSILTLYPFVEVTFQVTTEDHYHIPLLINPFGYTTYRGT